MLSTEKLLLLLFAQFNEAPSPHPLAHGTHQAPVLSSKDSMAPKLGSLSAHVELITVGVVSSIGLHIIQ